MLSRHGRINVHKIVAFCFQFGYGSFKSGLYAITMKGTEAVTAPFYCNPLFYLSSFQIPFAGSRRCCRNGGFSFSAAHTSPLLHILKGTL